MRRLIGGLLLASFALLLPLAGHAQDAKKDKTTTTTVDSATLTGDMHEGVLKTVPGSDRLFTVEVTTVTYVPVKGAKVSPRLLRGNGPGVRRYNSAVNNILNLNPKLASAQQAVAQAKTASQLKSAQKKYNGVVSQVNKALGQLAAAAPAAQAELLVQGLAMAASLPGLRAVPTKKTIEFQAMDDVKVRTTFLPEAFDEKGNPKKYTKEEKEELKGKDKKLPGYESSLEKLEVGQKLRVHLAPVKKTTSEKDKPDAKDKDLDKAKEKDKDADKEDEKKKQAKMIVILEEAPASKPKGK